MTHSLRFVMRFATYRGHGVWVPAFAGTTAELIIRTTHKRAVDVSYGLQYLPAWISYHSHRMNILSIQSHVAYGHVGNSAAVFPLQRIGVEVWPVDTVQYSNHTGYETWRGRALSAEAISDVVEGIDERGVLGECDGVLSGYFGSADVGAKRLSIRWRG